MKKILIILFASLYAILATGANLNLHYCGGKLKKISLFNTNEKGCCGNKMKSKGCCKDKGSVLKIKDNHKTNSSVKVPAVGYKLNTILPSFLVINTSFFTESVFSSYSNFPPVVSTNPLYLKNRILLI